MFSKRVPFILGVMALLLLCANTKGYSQYSYQNTPLLEIIESVETKSSYRFLYRESQLADISLSFNASNEHIIDSLRFNLSEYNISLEADTARKQIVLFKKSRNSSTSVLVTGQVVDAETGERLPYATIFWENGRTKKGVASNSSGAFKISANAKGNTFTFNSSYLGYQQGRVSLNLSQGNSFEDVTIRLTPVAVKGNDLIVTGFTFPAGSDSLYRNFVNTGVLNPFGENNTARALQSLPSVSSGTAINNGIVVRGSSPDATHILLDGMTIYNQSHLFGLLDSFNPSALQTSGFFYDVTPAQFQSSPGGTLSMLTKTGSLNNFASSAGLSNTAFNATINGPLISGKSSWLLSGRTSYMNTFNWFGNKELIAYGLNIDRPSEVIGENLTELESRLVFPGDYDAAFFDLHGKLYFEFDNGSRLIAGGYYGADDVSQNAERLVRQFTPNNQSQRFNREQVQTLNQWGNFSSSISYKSPVSSSVYSHTMVGASIYNTEFSKDDFVYNRVERNGGRVEVFTYPLHNQSVFNEFKIDQSFDLVFPNTQWVLGFSSQYFMGEYFEESFDRPGFFTSFESGLFDVYGQIDYTKLDIVDIHLGSRLHYFTNDSSLYFSPRVKLRFLDKKPVSFSLGYSRNYQFTHRLSFYNVSSPDIWIISSPEQPPTTSDYYTAGMYLRPFSNTLVQIEGYYKSLDNARLFEINAQTLTNSFEAPPWLYDNDGISKGVELLIRNSFKKVFLTNSYTLSEATFENSEILGGSKFYADWDRTHSFNSMIEYKIIPALKTFVSLTIASGVPNRLYFLEIEEQQRLDHYQRVDAGVEYNIETERVKMDMNFSVFNALNDQNTWYRELNLVIDTSVPASQQRLTSQPMDVYDLGIQPSFNVMVWF